MDLERALDRHIPRYRVCMHRDARNCGFSVVLTEHPECMGFGPTIDAAVRDARRSFNRIRDAQVAEAIEALLESENSLPFRSLGEVHGHRTMSGPRLPA